MGRRRLPIVPRFGAREQRRKRERVQAAAEEDSKPSRERVAADQTWDDEPE